MGDLLWPGDGRAADVFTEAAFLAAMVEVEQAWLDTLAEAGLASSTTLQVPELSQVAAGSEAGGNPVIPLIGLLRRQNPDVHRGLTSQDVLDTALVLCLREALDRVQVDVGRQARALAGLAATHRGTVMVGRTLTQTAVPITFGLKAATWLNGLSAAAERRAGASSLPAQLGGAAGTWAAVTAMTSGDAGPERALDLAARTATRLGLVLVSPWHTERSALTAAADGLVSLADAWGRIAADVALGSRPEIGELREAAGGGSSTMPGKANPVLSTLVRRHALAAPVLAASLHVAASSYVDERPDGAWHVEWDTLATLARRSVVAASQGADLLEGLVVDAEAMTTRAAGAASALTAERRSITGSDGSGLGTYLGATDRFIDDALERARLLWKDLP